MGQTDFFQQQQARNKALIESTAYMRDEVTSEVLPFQIDIDATESLSDEQILQWQALQVDAARMAIESLASLAKIGELDHLGGALDLIPALLLTLSMTDYDKIGYGIENGHTSIGYFAALGALGFLSREKVVDEFRRGLDIPGHVSWVPGGTQLGSGRLGVTVPLAVGKALGRRAMRGDEAWIVTHCGDAGWISGQALNGYNAADLHNAPITFVMHRNGVQLSGATHSIMDKDPRPVVASLGVEIVEIASLHDPVELYKAYREARTLAKSGRPSMIFPVGETTTLHDFANRHGIADEVAEFAAKHDVNIEREVWIPGALMSFRDVGPMLECVFLVNDLPGGEGHHDGHMKGRDPEKVLANPMLQMTGEQKAALDALRGRPKRKVVTKARPAPGTPNLPLDDAEVADASLPKVGESKSARAGVEAAYALVAKKYPEKCFVVSCDLNPSTKLGKACGHLAADHVFEMSIEEQASALMADGLAMASNGPQLNVFSTFGAFYEGIAREGLETWHYQRNLNGVNEGLNVVMHISHVGACTGRDHFSGWCLEWIGMAISYLPYLDRFYAPADARAAFIAVRDLAARYGGHIIGVPRDNLPTLTRQDADEPLWAPEDEWEDVTMYRCYDGAKRAILAIGAPAFVAGEAAEVLKDKGLATDVYIVNGLPMEPDFLPEVFAKYPDGVVTIEDGVIGERSTGLRGFAGLVAAAAYPRQIKMNHLGITDPRIAPSEGHMEVWAHFGITAEALVEAVETL